MKNTNINQYGKVAAKAVKLLLQNPLFTPEQVWFKACVEEGADSSKGCPRGVFLSLCELGLVKGVKMGNYAHRVRKNKEHTIFAMANINFKTADFSNPKKIWEGLNIGVSHNGQIDVIYGLYTNDLLKTEQ